MGLMHFSRGVCAGVFCFNLVSLLGSQEPSPTSVALLISATLGFFLFDREIRREMASRE
jgi:hypothetical protein